VICKRACAPKRRAPSPLRSVVVFVAFLLACLGCSPAQTVPQDPHKHYALLFGTVWGPDARPVYGVKVLIRRADHKKAKWELYSNHTGEFAQRVPPGPADYVVWADAKSVKAINNNRLHPGTEVTVHVAGEERVDLGLHLN